MTVTGRGLRCLISTYYSYTLVVIFSSYLKIVPIGYKRSNKKVSYRKLIPFLSNAGIIESSPLIMIITLFQRASGVAQLSGGDMTDATEFLKKNKKSRPIMGVQKAAGNDPESTESQDAIVKPLELGKRVREIRLGQHLTLEEASLKTGLARSTLSKIENDQISPTFAAVTKLVNGLGIDLPQLFSPAPKRRNAGGRRDITRAGEGRIHPTPTYEHELLATELSDKKMIPYRTKVRARSFDEYREWVRHDGEEFLLVLSGSLLLYTEYYQPVVLNEGDSAYYDAQMGHALVSTSDDDAMILWVTA